MDLDNKFEIILVLYTPNMNKNPQSRFQAKVSAMLSRCWAYFEALFDVNGTIID